MASTTRLDWSRIRPFLGVAAAVLAWDLAVRFGDNPILPGPLATIAGLFELVKSGVMFKHIIASLFRVSWGYFAAVLVAVPLGLVLGSARRGEMALNPLIQIFRPISPLAWIPIAILWFGVSDLAAVFLIFIASALPIAVAAMSAVHHIPAVHLNAGRNFGLTNAQLLREVIYPSVMPRLLVGLRLALGVSWIVVVAAEMIAVNSGLGFLIIDSRNAGDRYDLVIAGMVMIGVIGMGLDVGMRQLERLKSVSWGYAAMSASERVRVAVSRAA
ncbi:ABC transporter permease [Myxococcota bacterium]|nr:ABC transporter permease [Myxococcota bacterium]